VVAGFQGMHKENGPYHHARARRVGHIGGRDRGPPSRRIVGDIYTDVDGVLFDRSAGRAARQAHVQDCLRGNARACYRSGPRSCMVRSVELVWCIACAYSCARVFVKTGRYQSARRPARHTHLQRGGDCGATSRHRHCLLQGPRPRFQSAVSPTSRAWRAAIFGPLAEANINVDMIVQNVSSDGATTDLTSRCRHRTTSAPPTCWPRQSRTSAMIASTAQRRRQSVGHRHRHAQPCRGRRPGLQGPGRAQDQHPRHHDLRNKVLRC